MAEKSMNFIVLEVPIIYRYHRITEWSQEEIKGVDPSSGLDSSAVCEKEGGLWPQVQPPSPSDPRIRFVQPVGMYTLEQIASLAEKMAS